MRDRNSEQLEKNRSACKVGTTKANKPKQTPAITIQFASLILVLSLKAPKIACKKIATCTNVTQLIHTHKVLLKSSRYPYM
jgi:hypothetical protein